MVNNTQSSSKTADNHPSQSTIAAKNSSTSVILGWVPALTTAMAAVALLSALYAIYANQQSQQLNNQQTQHLNLMIDQLKQQQFATKTSLETLKTTAGQSQASLQNQMQAMNKNLQSALQQRSYQKQDWLLLKARYYLELAQINAHWSDDQQATIALLQQADALLRTIPDQQLFAIRQAIAQEIIQLQALPKIDTAGLLSQLDAAENAIANLPIKQPLNSTPVNSEKDASNKNPSPWHQKLQESINILEKIVVVRRNDEDIQPLLSPLHQTLLRDSIRLNLQEAQGAILQNDPKIYQLSLAQALQDITRAFDENATATQALIQQLHSLQQEKLRIAKPTIDQSLPLLNQLIESKNSQAIDSSATKEGDKTQ